jgi:hypothetical protein
MLTGTNDLIRLFTASLFCVSLLSGCAHQNSQTTQTAPQPRSAEQQTPTTETADQQESDDEALATTETAPPAEPETPPRSEFAWQELGWGSSRAEVAERLASDNRFVPVPNSGDQTVYTGLVAGRRAWVLMKFSAQDELKQTAVLLAEKFNDPDHYLSAYDEWVDQLQTEYGDGKFVAKWRNHRYSEDRGVWAEAVAGGHLTLSRYWNVGGSRIATTFTRLDSGVMVAIYYTSPGYRG